MRRYTSKTHTAKTHTAKIHTAKNNVHSSVNETQHSRHKTELQPLVTTTNTSILIAGHCSLISAYLPWLFCWKSTSQGLHENRLPPPWRAHEQCQATRAQYTADFAQWAEGSVFSGRKGGLMIIMMICDDNGDVW